MKILSLYFILTFISCLFILSIAVSSESATSTGNGKLSLKKGSFYDGYTRDEILKYPTEAEALGKQREHLESALSSLKAFVHKTPALPNRIKTCSQIASKLSDRIHQLQRELGDHQYACLPGHEETMALIQDWPESLKNEVKILQDHYPRFLVGKIGICLDKTIKCQPSYTSGMKVDSLAFFKLIKDQYFLCLKKDNIDGIKAIAHILISFTQANVKNTYVSKFSFFNENKYDVPMDSERKEDPEALCFAATTSCIPLKDDMAELKKSVIEKVVNHPDNAKKLHNLSQQWSSNPQDVIKISHLGMLKSTNTLFNFLDGVKNYLIRHQAITSSGRTLSTDTLRLGNYLDPVTSCLAHPLVFPDRDNPYTLEVLNDFFQTGTGTN